MRLEDPLPEPEQIDLLFGVANALLDRVREADLAPGGIEDPDVDDLGVEDLLDPVPDEVVHRLHVEVLGQPLLDVVDERQLGVALSRLLDRPGPAERGADMGRDEGHDLLVRFGVRRVSDVALHDHRADDPTFRPQRDAEPIEPPDAELFGLSPLEDGVHLVLGEQHRNALPEEVRGDTPRLAGTHRLPDVGVRPVRVDGINEERPIHCASVLVVQDDVEVPCVHQLAHDPVDRGIELLHVLSGARRLGDPVQGGLELGGAIVRHVAVSGASAVQSLIRDCLPLTSNSSTKARPSAGPVMFVFV